MKTIKLCFILCAAVLMLSACGQKEKENRNNSSTQSGRSPEITSTENRDKKQEEGKDNKEVTEKGTGEKKEEDIIEDQAFHDWEEAQEKNIDDKPKNEEELTYEEMADIFYKQYYAGWTQEKIEMVCGERAKYYQESSYYEEITDSWENTRDVKDIANIMEPLFFTDMKYYSEKDFMDVPLLVIHLAKNEIYAKHGYIFNNIDLYNYFMGCIWYEPFCPGNEFDDTVFNNYERHNLDLLSKLDKY